MSLIFSTGTNIGDRVANLADAKQQLTSKFQLVASSNIYQSPAVDYLDQPDFLNQVLEFEIPPKQTPQEVLSTILEIEKQMGRVRNIPKGPRTIDIDLLFWNIEKIDDTDLTIPHPRLFSRSFIVLPLMELPYAANLKKSFVFPQDFSNTAEIYQPDA